MKNSHPDDYIFDFDLEANIYYFPVDSLVEDNWEDFIYSKIKGYYIKIKNYSLIKNIKNLEIYYINKKVFCQC